MLIRHCLSSPFHITTIDDIFSDSDLDKFRKVISDSEEKVRRFTSSPFKNGKVSIPEISELIYEKIAPFLEKYYIDINGDKQKFLKTANIVMFADVKCGQQFGLHTDTGYVYEAKGRIKSSHTVLIYLNDDFEGGSTQFFDKDFGSTADIKPRSNRTLIFDINLLHQGNPVMNGSKFWIGTELICEKMNE